MSTKLKLLGVDVGSIGDAHGATPGSKSYRFIDEASAATAGWWSHRTARR